MRDESEREVKEGGMKEENENGYIWISARPEEYFQVATHLGAGRVSSNLLVR
jgi:hypothetical protein